MTDIIIATVLAVIVAAAACYIYKAKKHGAKCIGCSVGGGCACCCCRGKNAEFAEDGCISRERDA